MTAYNIKIYGVVQGVGFRPYVSRLAHRFGIRGTVANKGSYVEINALASSATLDEFLAALPAEAPERAAILKIDVKPLTASDGDFPDFAIIESVPESGSVFVSPDIATCEKCRQELYDPHDRRYLHPFINCTACGPRLTILDAMPYDRERTSMKDFPMCEQCAAEYNSPASRRYDAQPVCCHDCGPKVYILDRDLTGATAITAIRRIIANGGIVAIKGIGGFHLVCDATNEQSVQLLRRRKNRPVKPFALMMKDIATVDRECFLRPGQQAILAGPQKPIMLLEKKSPSHVAPSVAPGIPQIGVMLPYAPIHYLLFDYPDGITVPPLLVMTSGNPTGAPICRTDEEARKYLAPLADLILSHDRRIRLRADDSVMDYLADEPYMIRRSRGYAPLPVAITQNWRGDVLAIGGELKNTFCVGRNELFYPSPYIGDMSDLRTADALQESVGRLTLLLEAKPSIVACDLHPRYNSTALAEKLSLPTLPVQHHYAHILSCIAENDYFAPVIGVAFDGTGYGGNGTVWGGEILQADYRGFSRIGSIEPFCQAGGDASATEGWRIALALLRGGSLSPNEQEKIISLAELGTPQEINAQDFLLKNNVNAVPSTAVGRLFDAVSALLNIRRTITFEGEAAMFLEYAALKGTPIDMGTSYSLKNAADGRFLLPTQQLFDALARRRLTGCDTADLAATFHRELANLIRIACNHARKITGLNTVALSGGCFQNKLLMTLATKNLAADGFQVLRHRLIPPNDGGLALGQAVAAMARINICQADGFSLK